MHLMLGGVACAGDEARQLANHGAGSVNVGIFCSQLQRAAKIRDGRKAEGTTRAPHIVPQHDQRGKIALLQGFQHRSDVLPAIMQIGRHMAGEF